MIGRESSGPTGAPLNDAADRTQLDPAMQRKRLGIYLSLAMPTLMAYGIFELIEGKNLFLVIHSITALMMIYAWWLLRKGGPPVRATHIFLCAILFMASTSPLLEGLLDSQSLWFLPIIPLAAVFILGRIAGYRYLIASALCLTAIVALEYFYFPVASEPYVELDWVVLRLVSLGACSAFAAISNKDATSKLLDIESKRDQMNAALDEAEAANRSKTLFLANMSHEIRNPMNGILGTADYLRQSGLNEEDKEAIETIARCGTHLLGLIDDILDLSQIESGELTIQYEPMKLGELLEHTVSLFRAKAQTAGIELHLELPPQCPLLLGDPKRLSQVLANLIGNAVKFSDGGDVRIAASIASAPETALEHTVQIAVIDQGIGMKPEQLSRLFGEFEQVDDSEGIERGGSGLGLAISKHLIQQMGGSIIVDSAFGQGSTFTLSLSLQESVDTSLSKDVTQLSGVSRLLAPHSARVLVVDDQPINLKLATLLMEKLGCDVQSASDGRQAIEACEQREFDIIFMDVRMPVLSGLEAAMLITQTPGPNQHTPIVALTACAFEEDRQACLDAGMLDHLPKPLRRAQLEAVLRKHAKPHPSMPLRKVS